MLLPKLKLEYWREILLLALMVAVLMADAFFLKSFGNDSSETETVSSEMAGTGS